MTDTPSEPNNAAPRLRHHSHVGSMQFRSRVPTYLGIVRDAGQVIVVTEHGTPAAALIPLDYLHVLDAAFAANALGAIETILNPGRPEQERLLALDMLKKKLGLGE